MGFVARGSVAVVTGGGSGIGRALSVRLAELGGRVGVVDVSATAAERAAATLPGAVAVVADVTREGEVRRAVETVTAILGPIDLYCSNAGAMVGTELGTDDEWDRAWRLFGLAHVYAARAVLPDMRERGGGHLVITASAAGLTTFFDSAPYAVTKHASVALAEWLAIAYGGDGIGVHCLCSQLVDTAMLSAEQRALAGKSVASSEEVAAATVDALVEDRFLVLPHPQVAAYEAHRVANRDRWLGSMRRLRSRVALRSDH